MTEKINGACLYCFLLNYKEWLEDDVPEEEYKNILDYQMPSQDLNAITVYTIRSPKARPDNKAKNEYYEWQNLVELNFDEA